MEDTSDLDGDFDFGRPWFFGFAVVLFLFGIFLQRIFSSVAIVADYQAKTWRDVRRRRTLRLSVLFNRKRITEIRNDRVNII